MEETGVPITLPDVVDQDADLQSLQLFGDVGPRLLIELGIIAHHVLRLFHPRIVFGVDFLGHVLEFGFCAGNDDEGHAPFREGERVGLADAIGGSGDDGVFAEAAEVFGRAEEGFVDGVEELSTWAMVVWEMRRPFPSTEGFGGRKSCRAKS